VSKTRTVVTVEADLGVTFRALAGFERALLLVALAEDLPKLTDRQWCSLRDAEDRRRRDTDRVAGATEGGEA